MRHRRSVSVTGLVLLMPATLWLLLFAVVPLGFLIVMSFWTSSIFGLSTTFTLNNYRTILSEPVYWLALLQTLRIAATVTLCSLLVSYPVAYFISRQNGMRRGLLLLMLFVPFWSSYVVRTFVWLPMLGRNGLINQLLLNTGIVSAPVEWLLYNEMATHIGLIYVYTLFMTLPILVSLERMDKSLIEAAADLGAPPRAVFTRIVLPLSMPGIISGCVMVFLLCCGAYVTPQLLGGARGVMIGNVIAAQYLTANNWALGAALSVTVIAIVLLILAVTGRWFRLSDVFIKR